jgi:hypothetical protein
LSSSEKLEQEVSRFDAILKDLDAKENALCKRIEKTRNPGQAASEATSTIVPQQTASLALVETEKEYVQK